MKKLISIVAMTLVLLMLIPLVASASESSSYTMAKGTTSVLYNNVHSDDGSKTWTTSNPAVVKLLGTTGNSCSVQAVGVGTATVSVSVRYTTWVTAWIPNPVGGGGYWGIKPETRIDVYDYIITVTEPGKADVVSEVKFNGSYASKINQNLSIGDTFFEPLDMKLTTSSGAVWCYDLSRLNFTSSNHAVAVVGENGVVHAVGKGTAVIKAATIDGLSDTYTVTVGDFSGYTAVSTPQQLNAIRDNLTGKYYLARNIVFQKADFEPGGAFYNNGAGWVPIRNFKGILNGNHYAIENLQANATGNAGLFANLVDATISNLEMKNCSIRGTGDTGAIAGLVDNDYSDQRNLIDNCKATGGTVSGYRAGGIAGNAEGAVVSLCQNSASVTGTYQVGGIVGRSFCTDLWFTKNTGMITGKNAQAVGGIAATSGLGSAIILCTNEGAVKGIYDSDGGANYGSFYLGGIVGDMGAANLRYGVNKGNITVQSTNTGSYVYVTGGIAGRFSDRNKAFDCYNTGSIQQTCTAGESMLGGIAGVLWSNQETGTREYVSTCYNTGSLTTNLPLPRVGGIIGGSTGSGGNVVTLVKDCYYINTIALPNGKMRVGKLENVLPLSATQFKNKTSFTGFDFNRIWTMGSSAPQLRRGNFPATYFTCTVSYETAGGSKIASASVAYNAQLTAPASPTRAGSVFAGWYKDAACTKPWNFKSDKVLFSTTLYAKWNVAPQLTITAKANNVAYGTVAGAGNYAQNTTVTLKATPKAGYRFVRWLEGSTAVSTSYQYSFTVTKARVLTAEFAKIGTPTVKAASAGYNSVKLTWAVVAGAKGYEVSRYDPSTKQYKVLATVTTASYTNTGLTTNTTYSYKVRVKCVAGSTTTYGGYSAIVSAKPVPATPASVKAVRASSRSIKLTWGAVLGMTKYEVCRATSSTGNYTKLLETTSMSYTNTGLTTGRTYYYKVRAYRVVNSTRVYGNYSAIVSCKP